MQSVGQNLFNQLLEISDRLLEVDPELYKTAAARLRENCPREPSPVKRAAGAESKGIQGEHPRRASTTFHKYVLPGDAGKREYYQCMVCGERRVTNSFQADHQHEGVKLSVRWYCPLCATLYAVTHRGYHIKNRHKCEECESKKDKGFDPMVKSESSENSEEEERRDSGMPPKKRGRPSQGGREDDETSQGSAGSEDASHDLLGLSRASPIQTPPPPPPPPVPIVPTTSQSLDVSGQFYPTDSAPIVHTATQEALGGLLGVEVSTTTRRPSDNTKMFYSSTSATITRP